MSEACKLITVKQARSLAFRYNAYQEAVKAKDYNEVAYWGTALQEIQLEISLQVVPQWLIEKIVADAIKKSGSSEEIKVLQEYQVKN